EVSPAGANTYDDLGIQALDATPFALNTRGLTVGDGLQAGFGTIFNNVSLNVRQRDAADFPFNVQSDDGSSQFLTIDPEGDVGLNNLDPPAQLSLLDGSLWIAGTDSGNLDPSAGAGLRAWIETALDKAVIMGVDYANPGTYLDILLNPDGGNVGVRTLNPTSPLTVNGVIETTAGGVKFPDGTVQTTAAYGSTTEQLRLGPGSFVGNFTGTQVRNSWGGGVYAVSGTDEVVAPVNIPVGARIQSMTVYYRDDVAGNLRCEILTKTNGAGTANGLGFNMITTGSGYTSDTIVGNSLIQTDRTYMLRIFPVNGGVWPGNSTLSINNVVIEWVRP
ncbi:MAG: hypothetical protein AAFX05_13640, partial [Planctomycetota bacterium]